MSALAPQSRFEFALVVLNGVERGTQYKLVNGRISIGRGSDNDIVVKDDNKISRSHAVISVGSRGAEISDVSDRNKVIVDGNEVSEALLAHGSIIQLGETKFQFKSISGSGGALTAAPASVPQESKHRNMARPRRRSTSSSKFYILVISIGLLFAWLFSTKTIKPLEVGIRSEENIDTQIKDNRKIVEEAEAKRSRLGLNTRQYEEAQPNFIKGFRDYRKGQYERAVESFQACLSLFPEHIQCKRYMALSQKKFDELIQYHMVIANKYKSQNQFSACKASYRNAMVMIRNPNNRTYVEAKGGFDACDALEGDRF